MEKKLDLRQNWASVKEKLKEINTDLTDEDLDYNADNEQELIKKIASKISQSEEDTRALIESVAANKGKAG